MTLLVGGVFGIIGYLIIYGLGQAGLVADNAAIAVVSCNVLSRLMFGDTGLMSQPVEVKESFFKNFIFDVIWSFAIAISVAFIVQKTGYNVFGFVLGAFALIFLYFGFDFPAFHHVGMVAGFAVVAFENVWIAALFGVLAMLIGNFIATTFNTNVKSHIDPPAATIALFSLIILNFF